MIRASLKRDYIVWKVSKAIKTMVVVTVCGLVSWKKTRITTILQVEAKAMICLNLKLSASFPTGIIITRRVRDANVKLFWIID